MTPNKIPPLFPETSPICFTAKHFKVIDKLLKKEVILQKDLQKETGLDKTTISEIKSDLISLGWCKEVNLYSCKEISIELLKVREINAFVGRYKFLKQALFVRPHSIILKAILKEKPAHFIKAIESFSVNPNFRLIISDMRNNKQYTLKTDYGKATFNLNGNIVTFAITGFVLPILKEDLDLFEDYIIEGIQSRFLLLHFLLKEHFKPFRIEIFSCAYLKSLHLGIITKENVSKIVNIQDKIKDLAMFSDKSIYRCDEIEAKGKINEVLNKVQAMLNHLFDENLGGDFE